MGASTTIRVAIISDTHGFVDPRITDIVRACDLAVHAGDIGNAQVLQALRCLATAAPARGTHRRCRTTRVPGRRGPDTGLHSERASGQTDGPASQAASPPLGGPHPGPSPVIDV